MRPRTNGQTPAAALGDLGASHVSFYQGAKRSLKGIWASLWCLVRRRGLGLASGPRGPVVRILLYHRISEHPCTRGSELEVAPGVFERQLETLGVSGWTVVPLSRVPQLLAGAGDAKRYLAITFDDGYRDNVTLALPLLHRHRMPAAFFVTSGFVGSECPYPWVRTADTDPESLALTWDEVRDLVAAGCEIHSHGVTHRDLRTLDDEEMKRELRASRETIQKETGCRPSGFCYPFGYLTPATIETVSAVGYEFACTCEPGLNHPTTPRHALRRTAIQTSDTLPVFRAKLEGAFDWPIPRFLASPLKALLLSLEDGLRTLRKRGTGPNARPGRP